MGCATPSSLDKEYKILWSYINIVADTYEVAAVQAYPVDGVKSGVATTTKENTNSLNGERERGNWVELII